MMKKASGRVAIGALASCLVLALGMGVLRPLPTALAQDERNVVEVSLVEWEIQMPTTLPSGPTTFNVRNNGSLDHNFRIEGEGIVDGFANDFPPDQVQILELDLLPGEYRVYSPISDYAAQGMDLTLTVTDGAVETDTAQTTPITDTVATTNTEALPDTTVLTDTAEFTDTNELTDTMGLTATAEPTITADASLDLEPNVDATEDTLGILTSVDLPATVDIAAALGVTATDGVSGEVPLAEPNATMIDVLAQLAAFEAPPISDLSARNAREVPLPGDAVTALLAEQGETVAPEAVGDIAHVLMPSLGGTDDILARVYTPEGDGPFPVVVYFHGGGWVIANLDKYDASARALTNAAETIVVSVAYRQAPEFPFPAAVEDAYDAYLWVLENAASINGDAARVAVAGESAGGNLAATVSLLALQRGDPLPVYQVLVYPVTQLVSTQTPSYETYANAVPLNLPLLEWFVVRYLADPADGFSPYASPLLVDDLTGLPPTTLITAEIDPLRSEGEAYARRLEAAGVPVVYQNFTGVTHEFFGMGAVLDEAQDAVALAAEGLTSAFATNEETTVSDSDIITSTAAITDTPMTTATDEITATPTVTSTDELTTTDTVTE